VRGGICSAGAESAGEACDAGEVAADNDGQLGKLELSCCRRGEVPVEDHAFGAIRRG
jgi:hypothetical protein